MNKLDLPKIPATPDPLSPPTTCFSAVDEPMGSPPSDKTGSRLVLAAPGAGEVLGKASKSIYLDYAAATPLDPRVRLSMEPYMQGDFYNPSSPYLAARQVRRDVDEARARVAYWLGARATEIIFTAGATESINIAIHGVMQNFPQANVIALATEHDAVLRSVARYSHRLASVLPDASVDMAALAQLIDDKTVLISIAYANNEIGTIQPMTQISQLIRQVRDQRQKGGNKLPLYFHTDASQAAVCLDLHAARLGVDLMTLNGGKIYGPKQTGVLYIKAGTQITSPVTGGGQEGGMRSGTENVPGIIGFATALEIAQDERKETTSKYASLRDELQRRILQALPDTIVNGNLRRRLPGSLHLSWPGLAPHPPHSNASNHPEPAPDRPADPRRAYGHACGASEQPGTTSGQLSDRRNVGDGALDGERLVMLLDERGVMAATGSACAANKQTASHVLLACGMPDDVIQGSLRLTVGALTTVSDIERAAGIIIESVKSLS